MSDDNRPIKKLPTEILCRVFFSAAEFQYTTFDPSYLLPHRTNLVLVNITAVCKQWRSVALECAVLWTNIAFSTSAWPTIQCARVFLSRSKQSTLSVYVWDSRHVDNLEIARSSKELLESISAQTHRISACQLSSPSPNFWRCWTLPAPNLRKLLVEGHGPEVPPVFHGEFPQLETLTSQYCTTWPLGNYATLVYAELRNHNQHITLMVLLDALTGCTALERLTLEEYRRLGKGAPRLTPIRLPRLRQIEFLSCDSALILEHLEVPSLKDSVIIFNSKHKRDILHALPTAQLNAPYFQEITSLTVDLSAHSVSNYVAGSRGNGLTAFCVGVYGVPSSETRRWTQLSFGAIASFAPLSNIRKLTLVTDAFVVPWELWLPNLSCVEELSVSCPKPDDLLVALLNSSPDNMLPLLRDLTIRRRGRYSMVDHTALMEFVLYRYRVARPLRQLRLHREEWEWIQRLDETWVLLAQSQRKCFRLAATSNLLIHF